MLAEEYFNYLSSLHSVDLLKNIKDNKKKPIIDFTGLTCNQVEDIEKTILKNNNLSFIGLSDLGDLITNDVYIHFKHSHISPDWRVITKFIPTFEMSAKTYLLSDQSQLIVIDSLLISILFWLNRSVIYSTIDSPKTTAAENIHASSILFINALFPYLISIDDKFLTVNEDFIKYAESERKINLDKEKELLAHSFLVAQIIQIIIHEVAHKILDHKYNRILKTEIDGSKRHLIDDEIEVLADAFGVVHCIDLLKKYNNDEYGLYSDPLTKVAIPFLNYYFFMRRVISDRIINKNIYKDEDDEVELSDEATLLYYRFESICEIIKKKYNDNSLKIFDFWFEYSKPYIEKILSIVLVDYSFLKFQK